MMKTKTLLTVLLTTSLLPTALFADGPLPTDPKVVAGDIAISNPADTQLMVQQSGGAGIVDWGSFSIAAGHGVQFNNGSGATLNRVTGNDLSSIFGTLEATGSVYLINQNGIVFGKSGVVNTGGTFVASTLDIDNGDFLAGGADVFAGNSDAYVINLGRISSLGGDVALLGRTVVNQGTIAAPDGTVGLVAGREILMRDASVDDGLFSVRIGGSETSVKESGAIRAAAAELRVNGGNVYALAGNTEGTIAATGVARVKGRVFLTAGEGGKVKVDKAVKATAADGKGGQITVNGGTVEMAGKLDVSGTSGGEIRLNSSIETMFSGDILGFGSGAAGTGGFVEVSGRHLTFGGTVNTGGGTVLIDPVNIEISNGSGPVLSGASLLTPLSIETLLRTQDVIIETSGSAVDAGTIVVGDAINWSTNHSLTFLAHGDVWFNASVQSSNAAGGDLNIVAGWDGSTSTAAFDATPFLTADLASQTLFGNNVGVSYTLSGNTFNALGILYIRQATQSVTTAVGARVGATRVFAGSLLFGSGGLGFTQLGYSVESGGTGTTIQGDIVVRSKGLIWLIGGGVTGAASQIGHGGMFFADTSTPTATISGKISVEAVDNIILDGGTAANTYAMIGNGSRDLGNGLQTQGNRSGTITVSSLHEFSIDPGGAGPSSSGWIGHETSGGTISGADVTIGAATFDQDPLTGPGAGGVSILDIAMLAEDTEGGTVTVISTDAATGAELSLTGTTANAACACASVTTPGDLIVQTAGDLSLDSTFAFSNLGGGNVALAAGRDFRNNTGADAFGTMKGRWLVFSTRPDNNLGDIGVLDARFVQYGTSFDAAAPFAPATGGNGLIFAVQPIVVVGDASMTYGGGLVLPGLQLTVNGVAGNAATFGLSLDGTFLDPTKVTFSNSGFVNAGGYAAALKANTSIVPPGLALLLGVGANFGRLTVDQAVVTGSVIGSPTKIYDGSSTATLTAANFLLSGFVEGEGATVTQTAGNYASANANAFGTIAVAADLAVSDFSAASGTLLSNYALPTIVTGTGAITQAQITGSIVGNPTKIYDGTTVATLTTANFLLGGFVAGEGATVTQTSGSYASANASATDTVAVALSVGDFAATGGTLLANYIVPTVLSGTGVITQAAISGSIIGTPTKVYDGTTVATLTAANFLLSGFVAGEGATVTQTVGSYASANASGADLVTVNLALGDFAAGSGTLLANYALPVTVTGNGAITQGVLVAGSVIGAPSKVYDGSNIATLTAANFLLTGFAVGEGATVTQTTGSYASANASGANLVTVTLAAGDFTATGSTLLSNYVLPVTVSGTGVITQAAISGSIIGTPTKVYDGTTVATLTAANFLLSGFVAGEGATVTQTVGSYASANASGADLVTVNLALGDFAAGSGTLLANYALPVTVTGNGAIDRAQLVVSIVGLPTKPYDGTNLATLTATNFSLGGFVAGEGATITQTVGTYAAEDVGADNTVTASLTARDYAANAGTLLANYVLPASATGPGLIDNVPAAQPAIPETRGLETFDTTPLGEPSGPAAGLELISTETTQRIMDEINAGSAFCKALVNQEFVIDCLSDRLQAVADGLSAVGEYSEVRAALEDAAQKLYNLALANASEDLSRSVARANGLRSSRPLTAVSSAALRVANAQAAAIIDGARLVLLRSSSGSERRSVAFSQVAQVVNSTKVLLRSS